MINYSPLPQRVRRIVKQYEYCIESVVAVGDETFNIHLKSGYTSKEGISSMMVGSSDREELIYFLKSVVKPPSKEIKVALYGFTCPVSGLYIAKGSNYIDVGGLKISPYVIE